LFAHWLHLGPGFRAYESSFFPRPHRALNGQTPAMKAGIADHQWTITEIAGLLDRKARKDSN
jgi:hypothetical protein